MIFLNYSFLQDFFRWLWQFHLRYGYRNRCVLRFSDLHRFSVDKHGENDDHNYVLCHGNEEKRRQFLSGNIPEAPHCGHCADRCPTDTHSESPKAQNTNDIYKSNGRRSIQSQRGSPFLAGEISRCAYHPERPSHHQQQSEKDGANADGRSNWPTFRAGKCARNNGYYTKRHVQQAHYAHNQACYLNRKR